MKEELIRIEHGYFHSESGQYQFDVSIAHGECIGVYVDEHLTSGTAYLDIFKGKTVFTDGRAFCCEQRNRSGALDSSECHCGGQISFREQGTDHARFCSRTCSYESSSAALPKHRTADITRSD